MTTRALHVVGLAQSRVELVVDDERDLVADREAGEPAGHGQLMKAHRDAVFTFGDAVTSFMKDFAKRKG